MKRNNSQLMVVGRDTADRVRSQSGWPMEDEIGKALGLTRENVLESGTKVDGRSLYRFLGYKSPAFTTWMKRTLEHCGAKQPVDYVAKEIMRNQKVVARRDYLLSVPLVETIVKQTAEFGNGRDLIAFIESAKKQGGQHKQDGFYCMSEEQVCSLGNRILSIASGLTGEDRVDSYVYLKQQICLHMGASDLNSIPESQYDYMTMMLDVVSKYCASYGDRSGFTKHPLIIRVADGRVVLSHKSLPDYVAPFNDSLWKPISESEKKKYEPWKKEADESLKWKNNALCDSRILGELLIIPLDIDVAVRPNGDGKIQITLNPTELRTMFDYIYGIAEEKE